jgi:D-alanyl-D-alanine carboxypeptidase
MNLGFFKTKLLYLSLISFVFIVSVGLALASQNNLIELTRLEEKSFTPRPVLKKEAASFRIISAQSVLAIDLDSGISLYEKDPDKPFLPASTTKIVTALVAMEYYSLDSVLKVGKVKVDGQKMGLVKGEEISFLDLLHGLLIYSANDAAEVLAQNFPGGRDAFIAAMNAKVKNLGLINTHFTNPSGLEEKGHVSTAKDLVKVAAYAMKNPTFAKVVATKQRLVKSKDGKIKHKLVNINELLGKVDGVLGVKTGWTENARENLVTYVERNGHRLMIALLGSQDRFGETEELINWMFENYEWKEVKYP